MPDVPLFHGAYGPAAADLPEPILRIHDLTNDRVWSGRVDAARGRSLPARLACLFFRFPPNLDDAPLTVTMTCGPDGETWARMFGTHRMVSRLRAGDAPGLIAESIWPFTAISRMEPDAAGISQTLVGVCFAGLRLPQILWPGLAVREGAEGTRYLFSVTMTLPWGAPLMRFEGWLQSDGT